MWQSVFHPPIISAIFLGRPVWKQRIISCAWIVVLAELFEFVDKKIGLDKTLIVLSADHGAPEAPEYMAEHGMETGRFPLDWFKKDSPLFACA